MKDIRELSEERTRKLRRGVVAGVIAGAIIIAAALWPLYTTARDTRDALEILRNQQTQEQRDRERGAKLVHRFFGTLEDNQEAMLARLDRLREILQACQENPTSAACNAPLASPSESSNEPAERKPEPKPTRSPDPRPTPSQSPSPSPSPTHSPKPPKDCFIEIGDVCADIPDVPPLAMFSLVIDEEEA